MSTKAGHVASCCTVNGSNFQRNVGPCPGFLDMADMHTSARTMEVKVGKTIHCLQQIWGSELEEGLAHYFSSQLPLLRCVVQLAADGAVCREIEHTAMAELSSLYTDPDRGVAIIAGVGLSFAQYKSLVGLLGKEQDPATHVNRV